MDAVLSFLDTVNTYMYTWVLIYVLAAVGIYFTIRTRGLQFRLFGRMVKEILTSGKHEGSGITPFQAFAIGLASRVGTGNIAGVAIAITLGGPGAVFWMWVIALIGMATAFVEATLAQLFKVTWHDGTFRGGPAFYIWRGLKSWKWGAAFAVALLFTFGVAFEMVQANTIAATLQSAHGVPVWITAILLAIMTGAVILGGIKSVARVAEWVAPLMAAVYILLALVILALNIDRLGFVFYEIIASAFGISEAFAGTAGGVAAAMLNGIKRGLYSNEAGMGSAPNAASTATTSHPARQGLIQSAGVFVDTMLVCSATAFMILLSDASVYSPGMEVEGATLTQTAVTHHLGDWMTLPMTILIFTFAYSTIIGNYAYAEINLDYLTGEKHEHDLALRVVVIASVLVGAFLKLDVVWSLADVSMGVMALINLVAIILLGKWAFGVLRDFEASKGGKPFIATDNPHLPGSLETDIWVADNPTLSRSRQ